MFVKSIIKKLGGSGVVARELCLAERSGAASVRAWVMRDSIPADKFKALAAFAARTPGAEDITLDRILDHAERRRVRATEQTAISPGG